jgi:hypothetical protein
MVKPIPVETSPLVELTPKSIERLADRLYSLGVANVTTVDGFDRQNLVVASRALRRMLAAFEKEAGRPLHTILLTGPL